MALTLLDIAAASTKQLERGIIENIVETSPVMGMIPFENTGGNLTFEFAKEGVLPQAEFRSLNAGFSDKQSSFDRDTVQLKPFGGQITIDRKLANQPNFDAQSTATRQLMMLSRAIALDWKDNFINGDSGTNAKAFNGLKKAIVDRDPAQTASIGLNLAYNGATNGEALVTGGSQVIIEQINRLIDALIEVPDVLITQRTVLNQIDAITATGNNSALAGIFQYGFIEIAGRRQRGATWDGIPMVSIDDNSQGTKIIDFDETQGSSDVTSEIYAVKFGDMAVKAIQDLEGPETSVFDESNGRTWVLDWAVAIVAEHPKSVARLVGILES